jgi:hypothetical protein
MLGRHLFKRKAVQNEEGEKDLSSEELATIRRRLRGKPLRSRPVQLLIPVAYTLACVAALVAVLKLADGIWLAIGLTVVAFFAGHIPEAFIESRYSTYREEWDLANSSDLETEQMNPSN